MSVCTLVNVRCFLSRPTSSRVARTPRNIIQCVATVQPPSRPAVPKAHVLFNVPCHVEFGEQLYLVGSSDDLGGWSPQDGIPLDWNEGDVWRAECDMVPGSEVEYKYIVRDSSGGVLQWQPCDNLVLRVDPAAGQLVVKDSWDGDHELLAAQPEEHTGTIDSSAPANEPGAVSGTDSAVAPVAAGAAYSGAVATLDKVRPTA